MNQPSQWFMAAAVTFLLTWVYSGGNRNLLMHCSVLQSRAKSHHSLFSQTRYWWMFSIVVKKNFPGRSWYFVQHFTNSIFRQAPNISLQILSVEVLVEVAAFISIYIEGSNSDAIAISKPGIAQRDTSPWKFIKMCSRGELILVQSGLSSVRS